MRVKVVRGVVEDGSECGGWAQTRLEGSGLAPMRTPFSAAACQAEGCQASAEPRKGWAGGMEKRWRDTTEAQREWDRCEFGAGLTSDRFDCVD